MQNTDKTVKIIAQDKNIVACIKPRGLSSEDNGKEPNTVSELRRLCGCDGIRTLHRLDLGVGGVMIYAKNARAAAEMSRIISQGGMKKEYLALVHGIPERTEGELEDFLFKDSLRNKVFVTDRERKGVKRAKLFYKTLDVRSSEDGEFSLVHITLETGRTHQIRVQFSSRKHPVAGDRKYGARDSFPYICLRSHKISFTSPFDKKPLIFEDTFSPDSAFFSPHF